MTLRQIGYVLEGENDRRFHDYELAYYTAWHSGLFSQPPAKKTFPKYEKHQPKRKRGRKTVHQSWQQQQHVARTLTAAFGGEFKKRDEIIGTSDGGRTSG